MSAGSAQLRVLLDAGVPDAVGRAFRDQGHFVIFHRDVLLDKTPDIVVAETALRNDAILIAVDNDMKAIAQRYGMTPRGDRLDRLSMIRICCGEVIAAKRVVQAMSLIEHEWRFALQRSARRMWIDIALHYLRSNR